jgi:hypothetical protein
MRAIIPHFLLLSMLFGLHIMCVHMAQTPNLYENLDAHQPVEISALQ